MKLLIRPYKPEDRDDIVINVYHCILESPYGHVERSEFNEEDIDKVIASPNYEIYVAEKEGAIVGSVFLIETPLLFSKTIKNAKECFWYVRDVEGRAKIWLQMLDFIESWAKFKGCRFLTVESFGRVDNVYLKHGFEKIATSYRREFNGY